MKSLKILLNQKGRMVKKKNKGGILSENDLNRDRQAKCELTFI